jgi:hypothetical protein
LRGQILVSDEGRAATFAIRLNANPPDVIALGSLVKHKLLLGFKNTVSERARSPPDYG